ncbi:MAG: 50S ribosomal protein L17 [Patescibacteria group bacterium]
MKHRNKKIILDRLSNKRGLLLRNLAFSLFDLGRIKTTEAKAKALKPWCEKLMTRAKNDSLHNRRELLKYFPQKLVTKMLKELAPKYRGKNGGYIRLIKLGRRKGDGASMAIIELV